MTAVPAASAHHAWFKSSYSGANSTECVEAAFRVDGSGVRVRDSKRPDGPQLRISAEAWAGFLATPPHIRAAREVRLHNTRSTDLCSYATSALTGGGGTHGADATPLRTDHGHQSGIPLPTAHDDVVDAAHRCPTGALTARRMIGTVWALHMPSEKSDAMPITPLCRFPPCGALTSGHH
ncbi:DUF397 domain-containing protein [Streptomyces sp. NPDC050738]|uniref:DUF397 domain-containing protein n=1 Tax=Streptomyces sp. NPDC050738 TaxID=3154744 RepID=UPI00342867BD